MVEDQGRSIREAFLHNLPRAMFVFLPLLAGAMMLMYWRPRHYYVEHLLLFVHNHAFAFVLLLLAAAVSALLPFAAGWVSFAVGLYIPWYMYRSMRVVYGQGRWLTIAKLALLSCLLPAELRADARAGRRLQRADAVNGLLVGSSVKEISVKELLMRTLIIAALIVAAPLAAAQTPAATPERTASPTGAEVYIISPKDGATVHNPVLVQFGLKGMGIAPAGVKFENTGHHHLLIDTDCAGGCRRAAPGDRQDRALRQGADRDDARQPHPRQAHPAAAARGPEPHPAQPAGDLQEDHHHGRPVMSG